MPRPEYFPRRRHKRHRRRNLAFKPKQPSQKNRSLFRKPVWTEGSTKILKIEAPNFTAYSTWKCKNQKWICLETDPGLEWFRRVKHPEIIRDWINRNHYSSDWIKPSQFDGTARNPSESNPVDLKTVPKHNDSSEVNRIDSLKDTVAATMTLSATAPTLEGNGVTTSSPLNCPACAGDNRLLSNSVID